MPELPGRWKFVPYGFRGWVAICVAAKEGKLRAMGVKFEEEIVSADINHISYQIIGNKPVSEHRGNIHFSQVDNTTSPKTEINYKIRCKAPWWIPTFLLSFFINKDVKEALSKLAIKFNGEK